MKIKAPFKISYDAPYKLRVWGFGLGYLPMGLIGFGYNVRGSSATLPLGCGWKAKPNGQVQIEACRAGVASMKTIYEILWNGKQVNTAISLTMAKQTKLGMERDYGPLPKDTLTIRRVNA